MAGLANEAFEPENTSDELSAIKYNTKEGICKPLFRFFVTKYRCFKNSKKEKENIVVLFSLRRKFIIFYVFLAL